jgi:hypothetical protein
MAKALIKGSDTVLDTHRMNIRPDARRRVRPGVSRLPVGFQNVVHGAEKR